jgi:hypothetical protein
MLLCEHLHRDAVSGRDSLIGLIDRIETPGYPCVAPTIGVYIQATDGRGLTPWSIVLVRPNGDEQELTNGETEFVDPTDVARLSLAFRGIELHEAGMHWIEFRAFGQFVCERRFDVLTSEEQP